MGPAERSPIMPISLYAHARSLEQTPLILSDGVRLAVRPIHPSDAPALRRLHARLSELSIYLRYFTILPELSESLARELAEADGIGRALLVVPDPERPDEIVALAQWDREPGADTAEFALLVDDRWQGRGLGLALMRRLVAAARARGIRSLYGLVLVQNGPMQRLLARLDLPSRRTWDFDTVRVDLDLAGAPAAPVTHAA
jgi:GNAT superfamily N-acetyltransferase